MAWYRCGMNGTYNATTVSRSGAICNYVANVGGVPLSRFIANITPVQAGSGDPSPSNPRTIIGVSSVDTTRTGKNRIDNSTLESGAIRDNGDDAVSSIRVRSGFIVCEPNTNYTVSVNSNNVNSITSS